METLEVDGWTVRHDRAATVACYRTVAQGDADTCGCSSCRNFALQRSTAFPEEFLHLLQRLGIDASKEEEAFDWRGRPDGDGLCLYGGWFCFNGDFAGTEAEFGTGLDASRFSFVFTDRIRPLRGVWREPMAAIEFMAPLPWLLPDESPE